MRGAGHAAHLRQLPALLVAHVPRRCADEAAHGVLLHVLAHVQAHLGWRQTNTWMKVQWQRPYGAINCTACSSAAPTQSRRVNKAAMVCSDRAGGPTRHGGLGVKKELGKGLAQLGLAHAGGAQEHEAGDGAVGVGQARPGPLDGVRHGLDRLVLQTSDRLTREFGTTSADACKGSLEGGAALNSQPQRARARLGAAPQLAWCSTFAKSPHLPHDALVELVGQVQELGALRLLQLRQRDARPLTDNLRNVALRHLLPASRAGQTGISSCSHAFVKTQPLTPPPPPLTAACGWGWPSPPRSSPGPPAGTAAGT